MSDPDSRYDRQGDEPPLRFDRRRAPRSRGPAPVTLLVSLLILVVVAGGVAFMYRSGARAPSEGPQPLGAPLNDVRAPAPPEQPTPDAAAGLMISKDDPNAAGTAVNPAPPPEEPVPPPPAPTAAQGVAPTGPPSATSSPSMTPPVPGGVVSAPGRQPSASASRGKAKSIDTLLAESDGAAASTARKASPAIRPAPERDDGPLLVQIGAFSSERLADQEWSKAASIAPGAMAGKGKRVVAVPTDNGTLYRTSITGFTSRDKALALCDQLKAAGGRCFVH